MILRMANTIVSVVTSTHTYAQHHAHTASIYQWFTVRRTVHKYRHTTTINKKKIVQYLGEATPSQIQAASVARRSRPRRVYPEQRLPYGFLGGGATRTVSAPPWSRTLRILCPPVPAYKKTTRRRRRHGTHHTKYYVGRSTAVLKKYNPDTTSKQKKKYASKKWQGTANNHQEHALVWQLLRGEGGDRFTHISTVAVAETIGSAF